MAHLTEMKTTFEVRKRSTAFSCAAAAILPKTDAFACGAAAVHHIERGQQAAEVLHPRGHGQGGDHPPPCPTKEIINPVSSTCMLMCHLFAPAGWFHPPPTGLRKFSHGDAVQRPDYMGRHLRRHDPAHTVPALLVREKEPAFPCTSTAIPPKAHAFTYGAAATPRSSQLRSRPCRTRCDCDVICAL